MKTLTYFLVLLSILIASKTHARNWQKIDIPGAYCGDGQPYSVFIDRKDRDKLLVEFMGGGACWSEHTCYGNSPLTILSPLPGLPETTIIAREGSRNPWRRFTALFFPYCTGDVFAGAHIASYQVGVPLFHYGYVNVVMAFHYLKTQGLFHFDGVNDVTVWGWSAGAIGALLHSETIRPYLSESARKTLIVDSPGLHFGQNFWRKFTPLQNLDFTTQFAKLGLVFSLNDGFLAPLMPPVLERLQGWEVGFLQSTRDLVMSMVFGDITPEAHRKLVLGPQGLAAVAAPYSHVKVWIADVFTHAFLASEGTAGTLDMKGESAWNFALRVYMGEKKNPVPEHGVLGFEKISNLETTQ